MTNKAFPGNEYIGRIAQFYTDQFQYWKDVTARINTTAERIRGPEPYELKDWLKDMLDLWSGSLTAAESAMTAPLQMLGDQRTPVLSFCLERGKTTTDPKTLRIAPVDDTVLTASDLFLLSAPDDRDRVIPAGHVVAEIVRRGALEVSFQNLDEDMAPGQYLGNVTNSDGPLAIIHLSVLG